MTEKFSNKYRVPTTRAQWHDYDDGTYFVTICTAKHRHLFGEIENGQIYLSPIGLFAYENLENACTHYPYVQIPLFTIMPNHLHAIVEIDGEAYKNRGGSVSLMESDVLPGVTEDKMRGISHKRGALSVVIAGIKRAVSRYAREQGADFAWQSRFYDRIIRNTNELNRIAKYIETNVAKWDADELNHSRP